MVVTDGFTGNVVLKTLEGGLRSIVGALLEIFAQPEHAAPAEALLPALTPLYRTLDPDTYGGAILLGVDGVCIISHGSTGATAMFNAINVAREMVDHEMVAELRDVLATPARVAPEASFQSRSMRRSGAPGRHTSICRRSPASVSLVSATSSRSARNS